MTKAKVNRCGMKLQPGFKLAVKMLLNILLFFLNTGGVAHFFKPLMIQKY
jgi:hypothetical protein